MTHFNLKSKGFTLIEVLIAILLLAFISLYTYKMIDTNTDTKDKVVKEDRLLLQTLTAVSRLDSDISQIYSPLYFESKAPPSNASTGLYQDSATGNSSGAGIGSGTGNYDGKTKSGFLIPIFESENKSTLIFLTLANRRKVADTKESRYAWVKYTLRKTQKDKDDFDAENSKSTGENELVRQTITNNIYRSSLSWDEAKSQVLLTHIRSLEFSFWDEREKKFATSIQNLNENKNSIRSIKMELIWSDDENHEQKIEKIFRILPPYFNIKADELKANAGENGTFGGGPVPPNMPNPNDLDGMGIQ